MVAGGRHTNLIFDVALPHSLAGQEKRIKAELDSRLNQDSPTTYYTVVTFDLESFNK
jgi:hypothetical protein